MSVFYNRGQIQFAEKRGSTTDKSRKYGSGKGNKLMSVNDGSMFSNHSYEMKRVESQWTDESYKRAENRIFNFINSLLLKEKPAFFKVFSLAVILLLSITQGFSQNCTANAGGNRTVCSSNITLTGTVSGMLGTLNSPLWTFVSGPVTPTIASPNNLTTNITGMTVDGNYTFRLTRTCGSGTAVNDVVITAHPRPAGFTAGPDITNICALTGTTPLAGVIPAGYTGSWQAVNIYSLGRFGTTVSTNAQFSSTTTATPTFSLINKANHQIDPAYYTILTITSADGICSYSDTAIVRFSPNPHINLSSKTTCFDPASSNAAQSFIQLDAAPYFSTQIAGAAGTAANGTTVTMNVVSQPSGGALAFNRIDNNFLYFDGINVPGSYVFTLSITDSCGTYTTPQRTFTYSGTRPRMVNLQPSGHTAPEQMTVYYATGSGGEVHCNLAGTNTPENFYFSIDPLDPASVLTTVSTDGIAPPGGFPTIAVSGAGTYNRTATITPPGSGWQVGTYKFRVNVSNSDGSCGYSQTYFIHVSDKSRPNVAIPDVSVCYPGTGTISATIPLPAVYQGVVNSSYFQDFSGQYDFTLLSRPAGSGVPTYTSGNLRSLTSTSTIISNLTMAGDYVFRVTAAPYNGAVGDFLGREYACSGTSMVDTFVVHVENPINANAGSDQTLNCANSLTLLGNSAGTGTGLWTKISSPSGSNPVIGSTSAANTTVTNVDISGTYSYKWTITSQYGGCSSSDTVSFVVSNVSPATPTSTVSDLMCGGNGYGSITVTSPLGSAYQYSINGTTWQPSPVFNNLLAGTYTVSARFASATTCVSGKTEVVRLRYCGTVFNDANGDKLISAGENGTNAGGTLYIYAVNFNTGIIENSIPVSANGTYSIPVSTDVNYNIVLSAIVYPIGTNTNTTPISTATPAGWVRTGEYINTGDPTADGIIYVVKRNDAKSNLNFGIQQPPVAVNDTTLNNAYGSIVTVNIVNNDRDSTPGTLDITRVSMVTPGTATNIVTDAQGDITSMTISGQGIWTVNATTGAITFTPQLGFVGNPTPIQYTVRDNAGAISNPATVVITYLSPVIVSGTVFNDLNRNTIINTGENFSSLPVPLYTYLVNSSGVIIDSARVASNGTYSLDAIRSQAYTVHLSTQQYPLGNNINAMPINHTPPAGFITTGENGGNTGFGDGLPDGILSVTVINSNVLNRNFGITCRTAGTSGGFNICINESSTMALTDFISGADTGGTWTRLTGSGITLNATGDSITLTSAATTSTYRYDMPATSSCAASSSIATVTISPVPVTTRNITICEGDSVCVTNPEQGARVLGPRGRVCHTTSGTYRDTLSAASQDGCDSIVVTNLTVVPKANAGADGSTSICDNNTTTITLANLITGEQTGGAWTRLTGTGGTFTAASGTFVPAAGATTSTFRYIVTSASSCGTDTSIATITITPQANAGADGNTNICDNSTASITLANLITGEQTGGTWTRLTGTGGTFTAASGTFVPAAGATTSTFRYIVNGTAPCGNDTSIATVTISICAVTISGTVFDDANGNTIINPGEAFTSLPVPLYVYLVNSSGIVVDSAHVSPNGTYTLTANPNQNYTIELSTVQYPVGTNTGTTPINHSLPSNWVTTGENANGTNDGAPNGIVTVSVGTSNIVNYNFGIEQRPDTDSITYHLPYAPTEGSDACLDGFSAPELGGSDPEDGIYTGANSTGTSPQGVIITSLPTYGQLWYFGFGAPVVVLTSDVTDSTLFDPSLFCFVFTGCGYTGTTFEYAYVDAAGVADATPGTYTITWNSNYTVSGNVFHDGNGNTVINEGEAFTSLPAPLYVYLVGDNGIVVDSAHVAPNGSYTLNPGTGKNYTLELSAIQYAVGTNTRTTPINHAPPAGWVTTGENGNNNSGTGDGNRNGVLAIELACISLSNQNFGIQRPPLADNKTYHVLPSAFSETPPFGYPDISSPEARYFTITTDNSMLTGYTHNGYLTGNDTEDCQGYESCNTGSTFVLDSLYPTTLLFYNFGGEIGVRQLTEGDTIRNYDPSKLVIYVLQGSGMDIPIGFTYSIVDNAGFASPPANYTIFTESALPVELLYFTATAKDCNVQLNWATASELNNDYFELERSTDAKTWSTIGRLEGNGTTSARNDYNFEDSDLPNGTIYYRLKQVDFDGATEYHKTISIEALQCNSSQVKVYPNPASVQITVEVRGEILNYEDRQIIMTDVAGRDILLLSKFEAVSKFDVSHLPAGTYFVRVLSNKKVADTNQIVISR